LFLSICGVVLKNKYH